MSENSIRLNLPAIKLGADSSYLITPYTKMDEAAKIVALEKFQSDVIIANQELNEKFALIQRGSQALVMRQNTDHKGDKTTTYLTTKDFHTLLANRRLWHPEMEKWIPIAAAWLTWSGRREYDSVYFLPLRHGDESTIDPRHFNLWRGLACDPDPNAGKFDKFLDHIENNICGGDKDSYHWVMAWLADIFQRPARKPGTALVLKGEMGIGKGVFANHIGHLLATHYFTITNSSQIIGKFNSHLSERILVFVDESAWSDEKIGEGTLRSLVTEPQIACEAKGKDVVMIDSFLRLIIAANKDWVVPVGMRDERRFTVLDAGSGRQRDYKYFIEIDEQLKNGGYQSLLHYLLNYNYEPNQPRDILHTDALLVQKLHSMPHEAKWLYDCLSTEKIAATDTTWPEWIECSAFYTAYIQWCDQMKINHRHPNKSLSIYVKKFIDMDRRKIDLSTWRYELPTLEAAREQFEAKIGHKMNWD